MENCLEAKRRERGLTRIELAKAVGVDRVTIWRWETGEMPISYESLLTLAEFFGVVATEIVPALGAIPSGHLPRSVEESSHVR